MGLMADERQMITPFAFGRSLDQFVVMPAGDDAVLVPLKNHHLGGDLGEERPEVEAAEACRGGRPWGRWGVRPFSWR